MSEIERAIAYWEEFEREIDEMPHSEILEAQREPVRTALAVLRAAIDREANEPPKCYECKNEADSWECERCIWGDKTDRYEPKEEPTCTQD